MKERLESNGSVPNWPVERSPRQCIAPELRMPRRVCVVNGPFIGWKSLGLSEPLIFVETPDWPIGISSESRLPKLIGMVLLVTDTSGLPRSQARSSISPKMWQLEHDASPLPEKRVVS